MTTETQHPILGWLVLAPDSWCWIGEFPHDGVMVELNLETFRSDQTPGLHVTEIGPEYCEAFARVRPRIGAHMRAAADWVCSDLQAWFDATDLLADDVLRGLRLSSVVLRPDGTASLWIKEPHLYEAGHSIMARIGLDGNIQTLDLA
jgi:hypothetical protein